MSRGNPIKNVLEAMRRDMERRKAAALAAVEQEYQTKIAALDVLLAGETPAPPPTRSSETPAARKRTPAKPTKPTRKHRYNNGHKPVSRKVVVPLLVAAVKQGYTTPRQMHPRVRVDGHRLTRDALQEHLRCAANEGALVRLMRGRYGLPGKGKGSTQGKGSARVGHGNRNGRSAVGEKIRADLVALARDGSARKPLIDLIVHDYGCSRKAAECHLFRAVRDKVIVRVGRDKYADARRVQ